MKKHWGRWFLRPRDLTLCYIEGREEKYLIPLVKCNSSEEILDWIVGIRQKPWSNDQDLCGLVDALDDLLDLEENFCGSGINWTDGNGDYAIRILVRKFGRKTNNFRARR